MGGCVSTLFDNNGLRSLQYTLRSTFGIGLVRKDNYDGMKAETVTDLLEHHNMVPTDDYDLHALMVTTMLSDMELQEAKALYDSLVDQNFQGASLVYRLLSQSGMNPKLVRIMCSALKANEVVCFPVIMSLIAVFDRGSAAEKLSLIFSMFDYDGSGALSYEEVLGVLNSISSDSSGEQEIDRVCDELFEELDTNGDGEIQFEEFIEAYPMMSDLLKLDSNLGGDGGSTTDSEGESELVTECEEDQESADSESQALKNNSLVKKVVVAASAMMKVPVPVLEVGHIEDTAGEPSLTISDTPENQIFGFTQTTSFHNSASSDQDDQGKQFCAMSQTKSSAEFPRRMSVRHHSTHSAAVESALDLSMSAFNYLLPSMPGHPSRPTRLSLTGTLTPRSLDGTVQDTESVGSSDDEATSSNKPLPSPTGSTHSTVSVSTTTSMTGSERAIRRLRPALGLRSLSRKALRTPGEVTPEIDVNVLSTKPQRVGSSLSNLASRGILSMQDMAMLRKASDSARADHRAQLGESGCPSALLGGSAQVSVSTVINTARLITENRRKSAVVLATSSQPPVEAVQEENSPAKEPKVLNHCDSVTSVMLLSECPQGSPKTPKAQGPEAPPALANSGRTSEPGSPMSALWRISVNS